jgi:sugar fermentation stimulation protein A
MRFGKNIVDGIFLERPNRYLARVEVGDEGKGILAHVPDPGRLSGLMLPGRKVRLVHQPAAKRKTDYTLVLVRHGSIWVSVFPVFANALIQEALMQRKLPFLQGYSDFASEVKVRNSRFDFRLGFPFNPAYVEVKSVSLVEQGQGRFPDAPTERGVKHVRELIALCAKGYRTCLTPRSVGASGNLPCPCSTRLTDFTSTYAGLNGNPSLKSKRLFLTFTSLAKSE